MRNHVGLHNLGNSCYINSVLQVLIYCTATLYYYSDNTILLHYPTAIYYYTSTGCTTWARQQLLHQLGAAGLKTLYHYYYTTITIASLHYTYTNITVLLLHQYDYSIFLMTTTLSAAIYYCTRTGCAASGKATAATLTRCCRCGRVHLS